MTVASKALDQSNQVPVPNEQKSLGIKWQEIAVIVFGLALGAIALTAAFHGGVFAHVSSSLYISYAFGAASSLLLFAEFIYGLVQYFKTPEVEILESDSKEIASSSNAQTIDTKENKADSTQNSKTAEVKKERARKEAAIISKCLELYDDSGDTWTVIKTQEESPIFCSKHPDYETPREDKKIDGDFKICISVDPAQMKEAIPLVLKALLVEDAPKAVVAVQNAYHYAHTHRVGKEFVITFPKVEQKEESSSKVGEILSQIHHSFITHGIRPDKGTVVTVATYDTISVMNRSFEAEYAKTQRFLRKIPGSEFFHYGHNYKTIRGKAADFGLDENISSRKENSMMLSEMHHVRKNEPEFAHNPLRRDDPYKDMMIFSPEMYSRARPVRLLAKQGIIPLDIVKLIERSMWEQYHDDHKTQAKERL